VRLESDPAVPRNGDDGAEIAPRRDIGFERGFEV
jgi:hypothetical protein